MNSYFQFKQFGVYDHLSTMKVGTDAVLLGAWVDIQNAHNALDVGTGCGVIALMLAQRSSARITAIDLDKPSSLQAKDNFNNSPWGNRLTALHADFREFALSGNSFDLIVSNPPYFSYSLLPNATCRKLARHDLHLSLSQLIKSVKACLTPNGRLNLILPYSMQNECKRIGAIHGLYAHRSCSAGNLPVSGYNRIMICFGTQKQMEIKESLYIRKNSYSYSEEYQTLTSDFYLTTRNP